MYRCWAKATDREKGPPRRSYNWFVARRGWLEVFPDKLEFGDWTIPLSSVRKAVMYEGRSMFMPASVLEVQAEQGTFQFGLNPWVSIDRHLPFPYERVKVTLRFSLFSIIVRAVAIGCVLYIIWDAL